MEYKTKIDLNLVTDRALSIISKKPNEKIIFYSGSLKEVVEKYRLNNFGGIFKIKSFPPRKFRKISKRNEPVYFRN